MKNKSNEPNWIAMGAAAFVVVVLLIVGFSYFSKKPSSVNTIPANDENTGLREQNKTGTHDPGTVTGGIITMPTIDYQELTKNKELMSLMQSRKENLGIDKSLDMVVKSDETIQIGKHKVSMRDILKKAFVQQGRVFEEKIEASGEVKPQEIKEYGIYVVQQGDSIWNIHFHILKDYYGSRGIHLSPKADEPVNQGRSSGVGKILKFSENLVIIYNLLDKRVDKNINILHPLSKIIVYNMDEVFALLKDINYKNVDRIQFDGDNIWVPTNES
ncbi:MAG: hypothetical protein GY729_13070 [Desulfobacteraceae bacterium]|nr:hypothetical protein [Desulfobacteraceae bacterium]